MKAKEFNKISKQFYNKNVKITFYDNNEFIGLFKYPYNTFPLIPVGDEKFDIKNIKNIVIFEDEPLYKYVEVEYENFLYGKTYYYKTIIKDIKVGDMVLVDCSGNEISGTVKSIAFYTKENAPYPVNLTKNIIKVLDDQDDIFYDDYDDDFYKVHDYHNLLLNNMFGRISIKRLMRLNSPKDGQEEYTLFYYPKFNIFFYKKENGEYYLAEYKSKLITDEMFHIIEDDSIEVEQIRYAMTTDSDSYVRAIKFCQENFIQFHDDTDVLKFNDEKETLSLYKSYVEPVKFNSIEEIKKYLVNEYKAAHFENHNPPYFIENGKIIHYTSWLQYDMRVFKIWNYMVENGYVDEKYYNRENYPEFFDEDWKKYDLNNLDIGRVSYLFLRIFNIERINEGTVDYMVLSGVMLKLIERAEVLKK